MCREELIRTRGDLHGGNQRTWFKASRGYDVPVITLSRRRAQTPEAQGLACLQSPEVERMCPNSSPVFIRAEIPTKHTLVTQARDPLENK